MAHTIWPIRSTLSRKYFIESPCTNHKTYLITTDRKNNTSHILSNNVAEISQKKTNLSHTERTYQKTGKYRTFLSKQQSYYLYYCQF